MFSKFFLIAPFKTIAVRTDRDSHAHTGVPANETKSREAQITAHIEGVARPSLVGRHDISLHYRLLLDAT